MKGPIEDRLEASIGLDAIAEKAGLESRLTDSREALNTEVRRSVAAEERCRELEAEVTRMKEHTWCAYCGLEDQ